jgi:small-conductance mechanosensitive channel
MHWTMIEYISQNKLLISLLFIVAALIVRWLLVSYIHKMPPEEHHLARRWTNIVNNAVSTVVVVGLIIIWLSELRFVALSIAAFAAALVIATRDIIQCFIGALYQTSTSPFSIGDWIQVGDDAGEVISSDWLTTKVLEVDLEEGTYTHTGKTIVIPNNHFVLYSVRNLNHLRQVTAHTFSIIREADFVNVCELKEKMLSKAQAYCAEHQSFVEQHLNQTDRRLKPFVTDIQPVVRVRTTELGKNELQISIVCPTKEAMHIEQKLISDFMQCWYQKMNDYPHESAAQTHVHHPHARRETGDADQAAN